MRKMKPLKNIALIYLLFITMVSILVFSYFWISHEYSYFKYEKEITRDRYISNAKEMIKFQVDKALESMIYRKNESENQVRLNLKKRLNEALSIVDYIKVNAGKNKSKTEIQSLVKDALRPLHFNDERGYFFAITMDGIEKISSAFPELEDKNLFDYQNDKGSYVIRREIELIKEQGEGYISDYWPKPGDESGKSFLKLSYIKYYEPFDWYFGVGEYLDDVEYKSKQEILKRLSEIRFGKDGYIFVNTYTGYPLIQNGMIVEDSESFWEFTDVKSNKVLQMERNAAEKGGDFIEYYWEDLSGSEPQKKISYIKGFEEWGWMLGTGFYVDDAEATIELERLNLQKKVYQNIRRIVVISIILVLLSIAISHYFMLRLNKNFKLFRIFFTKAAKDYVKIDKEKIHYQEFYDLAESANEMIEDHIKSKRIISENEQKLKAIIDNLGEGLIICDLKDNIEFANAATEKIFGVEPGGLIHKNLSEFMTFENFKKVEEHTEKRKLFISSSYDMELIRPDGSLRNIIITATPKLDFNDKVVGSYGIFFDITERKKSENELKNQREHLELINQILRHDLTNKLAAIKSGIKIFKKVGDANVLNLVLGKVDSSVDLIRKMKEFEDVHIISKNLRKINIRKSIEKVLMSYPDLDVTLEGKGYALANDSISSVFDNIITNAMIHGETNKIDIEIISENPLLKIIIKDFGVGIPDSIKDRIFENGFKFGKTARSGLGLYIVKKAVESIDGKISFHNNQPSGTVFEIELKKA